MSDGVTRVETRSSGVLIVGFGAPGSIEAVRPFMCELMGREPSDEVVDDVCLRYLAIGGESPLVRIAAAISEALASTLAEKGLDAPVRVGMRYSEPTIAAAVDELVEMGVGRIVTVSLSPLESKVTHDAYRAAITEALEAHVGVESVELPPVGSMYEFAEFVAASAMSSLSLPQTPSGSLVVFTAHSLPVSDLAEDDPYVNGLRQVIDSAVEYLGWEHGTYGEGEPLLGGISTYGALGGAKQPWVLAYQSKGKRPGEWLGPSLEEVIDAAHAANVPGIVCVPAGFMTDHLETLFDLDIEAAGRAFDYEMEFVRGPVPNDHAHLIDALAQAIQPLL